MCHKFVSCWKICRREIEIWFSLEVANNIKEKKKNIGTGNARNK